MCYMNVNNYSISYYSLALATDTKHTYIHSSTLGKCITPTLTKHHKVFHDILELFCIIK